MENSNNGGFFREMNEDRRDYGEKGFGNGEARVPSKPKRPRIGRSQPSVERLYSSNDERRFIPAGERRSYSGNSDRRNSRDYDSRGYNDRNSGSRREYGSRGDFGGNREYGDRRNSEGRGNSYGERRSYGNYGSQYGSRKEYGSRSYGDAGERRRSPYGERRGYQGNSYQDGGYQEGRGYSDYGDRRFSPAEDGERRTYGNGNRRNAAQGRRPAPAGRKPQAAKQFRPKVSTAPSGINKMIDRKRKQAEEAMSDFDYTPVPVKDEVRLNKFISNSGICSRREADNFILAGVVTVNGQVVTELGTKISASKDDVRFNGERLKGEKKVYIVMNKPKGFVTTTSDPHAEKTVMELLKSCKSRVFSVGRLDKNTTGVLMFTNDGEMAEKLTHPSYNKKKIYQVTLSTELSQEDFDRILQGVTLTDGDIAADELEYIDDSDHRKIGIEIHSGKNRIVRRIFESLGYEVKGLDRVYFAGLTKKGLKKGQWRYLSDGEVNILRMGSYQ